MRRGQVQYWRYFISLAEKPSHIFKNLQNCLTSSGSRGRRRRVPLPQIPSFSHMFPPKSAYVVGRRPPTPTPPPPREILDPQLLTVENLLQPTKISTQAHPNTSNN